MMDLASLTLAIRGANELARSGSIDSLLRPAMNLIRSESADYHLPIDKREVCFEQHGTLWLIFHYGNRIGYARRLDRYAWAIDLDYRGQRIAFEADEAEKRAAVIAWVRRVNAADAVMDEAAE